MSYLDLLIFYNCAMESGLTSTMRFWKCQPKLLLQTASPARVSCLCQIFPPSDYVLSEISFHHLIDS